MEMYSNEAGYIRGIEPVSTGSGQEPVTGYCEHGNQFSCCITGGEIPG
jgi:hypothetical protein